MTTDAPAFSCAANVRKNFALIGGFMKRATMMLTVFVLLGALATLDAQFSVVPSQLVIGFTGGSTWTSYTTGTCVWYFPVLGNVDLKSLFMTDTSGTPIVDKEHAYLIWVSKWSIAAPQFSNPGISKPPFPGMPNVPLSLAVVPAGDAVIYFNSNPLSRDWTDPGNPGNLGTPVARFNRGAGLFQSADGWMSDKFYFSAPLLWSRTFTLGGKPFNFFNLVPRGMTCFEYGQAASTSEAGSCTATGN